MCDHHHAAALPDALAPALDRRALLLAGAGTAAAVAVLGFEPAAAGTVRTRTFRGRFDSPDTPDWVYLDVKVPRGVRAISVDYDYEPSDTGFGLSYNVVDIGIFDPSGRELGNAAGFRGWSGGARRSFRISRTSATPGYLAGPITPGTWRVALGPYLIVPPGTPYTVRVSLRFGRSGPRFVPEPARSEVPGTGPGWYRGDLHTHTFHSDGKQTQRELVQRAQAAGLDFIASTEHNTSSAHLTWGRHVPEDFLVVCGEEVTTRNGHWLALGLPAGEWVDWRYRAADGELGRFTDAVRAVGGLAVAAHPWLPVPSIRWEFGYDFAGMDAIEVWNGPWTGDDQTALAAWHTMLTRGRFLPVTGSSDTHREDQQVGLPQTVVRAGSLSTAAVVAGLRGGHAWVAESSAVQLSLTASLGQAEASCGDRLPAAPTDLVDVRLEVAGVPGCLAQLIGPAGPVAGAVADAEGHVTVTVQVPAGATPFVRAEVRRLDGAPVVNPLEGVPALPMVALTNPVFLSPASA